MRSLLVLLVACCLIVSNAVAGAPEKKRVTIAVGGKAALYYLPLSLAEQLGYFREAGLEGEPL